MLRTGRRVNRFGWSLRAAKSPVNAPRFAVIIAKRHVRTAVARNRIRRVLREYFRQELQLSLPGMDFLLLTTAAQKMPPHAATLRAECRQLFSQLLGRD